MKNNKFANLLVKKITVASLVVVMLLSCKISNAASNIPLSGKVGRPLIVNNTLVASDGTLLRGGTFWIYGWIPDKTTWALSDAPWKAIRDNHLNIVRIACAYRPERENNYSLDQYEGFLDGLIDRAEKEGIYVVIDFHPKVGTYKMNDARDFWTRFASRYNDRKNVIYELVNEPVFTQPENYTDKNLRDFEDLWHLTNSLAPNTPSIIMTFCQTGNMGRSPKQVTDSLRGIDWTKTVVGFHSYWRDNSERIVDLKKYYPCFNTEFNQVVEGSNEMKYLDGYKHHSTRMEELGISWMAWTVIDRQQSLEYLDSIVKDARTNGVYWGIE